MIVVNGNRYNEQDFNKRIDELFHINQLKKIEGKLIGVCLGKPFDFLSLLFFIIKSQSSILIIHPETPLENAIETSRKAGCSYLVYQDCQEIHSINGSFQFDKPSILQYSSGTTGEPKLIERSWDNIERETDNYNRKLFFDPSETPVLLVPLVHSYGLGSGVLAALKRGSTPIIITERNPKFMAHMIKKTQKAIIYGTPFFFNLLLSLKDPELQFHKVVSSGAPLSEKLLEQLKRSSYEIFQQYGSTETGCIALGKDLTSATDVGIPLQYLTVNIDGDNGPGEIKVSFDNKVVHTRDLGYFSNTGSLNIINRLDDLINVGGQKVIPYEVEMVIARLEKVKEVVVYKMKHPIFGETVKAMVVASGDITAAIIKNWCQKHLPPFKIPYLIEIVEEIPKTPSGKVSRKLLIEKEKEQ
jgi:3,4-dihydroxybenzoate---[aryl-carrier protein] ligase